MKIKRRKNIKKYIKRFNIKPIYNIKVDKIEKEMNDIYENRNKYSLKWVYQYSHKLVDDFLIDNIFFNFNEEHLSDGEEKYKRSIIKKINVLEKIIAKKLNNYKRINFMLTSIELFVSVLLILGVHNITEMFIDNYAEYANAGIIVLFFALFKVFIEDKILRPTFEKNGWKLYKKNIGIIKENLNETYTLFDTVKKMHIKQ